MRGVPRQYDFRYAATLRRAALDHDKAVRIVWGPVESGKTVWLLLQLFAIACTIPRCHDGIRRSRFLIVRGTDAELQRGIMRTWANLFPEEQWGAPQGSMPSIHKLKFLDVEAEFEFFAFEDDSEPVLKKLRSTEYTAAAINEGQFTPLRLVLAIRQRTGRFPDKVRCPDFDRKKRVVMDMNAPRTSDHWVLYMNGDVPIPADMPQSERYQYRLPPDWAIYKQPGVVLPRYTADGEIEGFDINPEAENLPYQSAEEILRVCAVGDLDDILRDYCNRIVFVKQGQPRYPKFKRTWHVSSGALEIVRDVPPIIGYDPGLTGAAVIFQRVNGQWRALREMNASRDISVRGAAKQGERMLEILRRDFSWFKQSGASCWGDPYGEWGTTDENATFYNILRDMGLDFRSPEPKDNPTLRHEIGQALIKAGDLGTPRLIVCPVGCPTFIDALETGAVMRHVKRQGDMVLVGEMVKNNHSHIVEAAEYAWWGGGESHSIVTRPKEEKAPPLRHDLVSKKHPFTFGRRREMSWLRR